MINYSYDYEELIEEVNGDIAEGLLLLHETIDIVRGETPKILSENDLYYPIIDYYFLGDIPNEKTEKMTVYDLIQELCLINDIFIGYNGFKQ